MRTMPITWRTRMRLPRDCQLRQDRLVPLLGIDGRTVHVELLGEGQPAVVVETGFRGLASQWREVADAVSEHTTVVLYDRAGHGESAAVRTPRTPEAIASELHRVLEEVRAPPPWVLVGHSVGGLYMRTFAKLFDAEVAGLVLAESSVEGQRKRRRDSLSYTRDRWMNARPVIEVMASTRSARNADVRTLLDELRHFRRVVDGEPVLAQGAIGTRPVVVLTQRLTAADGHSAWRELQASLTNLSSRAEHLVSDIGGHDLHRDDPELVVASIVRVVEEVREQSSRD
jgi:pimeloyl-ACP methyl ester carboxylesterase